MGDHQSSDRSENIQDLRFVWDLRFVLTRYKVSDKGNFGGKTHLPAKPASEAAAAASIQMASNVALYGAEAAEVGGAGAEVVQSSLKHKSSSRVGFLISHQHHRY